MNAFLPDASPCSCHCYEYVVSAYMCAYYMVNVGEFIHSPLYPYSFLFVIIIGTVLSIRLPCFVIVNTVSLIGYGIN